MEFLQYFLQVLGATMVVFGYLSSHINNKFISQHSFWIKLNEVTALKETHEYIMHKGANIINGLIFVSGFILLLVICYGIAFPDTLLKYAVHLEFNSFIKNAIEGSQLITFMALFGLSSLILIASMLDKFRGFEHRNVKDKLLLTFFTLIALACLYIIFTRIFPALFLLDEVINPVFKEKFISFMSGVLIPFSTTTLILVYPILVVLGLVYVAIETSYQFDAYFRSNSIAKQITTLAENSLIFIVGFVGSMFYTLVSGALGTSFGDAINYDISFRLVIINALFDGITLYVTVKLLNWASAAWKCRMAMSSIEKLILAVKGDIRTHLFHRKYLYGVGVEGRSEINELNKMKKDLVNFKENYTSLEFVDLKEKFFEPFEYLKKHSSVEMAHIFNELSLLSAIMGNKSAVAFDRALYRRVLDNDPDIKLINGTIYSEEKEINPNQSWFFKLAEIIVEQLDVDLEKEMEKTSENHKITEFLSSTWKKIDICREGLKGRAKVALFSDCLLAAAFSFLSIYLSVYGTDLHMNVSQLWSLFVGGFNGSDFTNIGPLFWVMHTTFIPSIVLWFLVISVLFFSNVINPLINFLFSLKKDENSDFMNEVRVSFAKTGSVISAIGTIIGVFR